ncbi:tetraspanin-7 [Neltuma alba]|uniref:tetraspanin-7 n=1 Tax=Neltuma alba TaxID=207710 RepID=UPI0010A3FECF|nr:tetraspanin-7-like [Prosopis alba]
MCHLSNTLIGILNFFTFLFSIPILWVGIWLSKHGATECEKWLDKVFIVLGVFLLLVSLAGLAGACCRISLLLWIYLVAMFLLILVVLAFTIFAFVVTNKGAGKVLSGKGYKEYRLGDYSHWLQKRVNDSNNWKTMKSCLQAGQYCSVYQKLYAKDDVNEFNKEKLTPLQSGCCKPSNDCNFVYQSPTVWNSTANSNYANPDCRAWNNDPKVLCYDCNACKAGMVQDIKTKWKKTAKINIIFLILLIIVYSVGCCAFRNNRRDNWK